MTIFRLTASAPMVYILMARESVAMNPGSQS
jgi:hypothetical protein